MTAPSDLYRPSLGLLTDLYELTMAQAYWSSGTADKDAPWIVSIPDVLRPYTGFDRLRPT